MAEDWFYHNSGQTFGPMSAKQLRQHALAGKITSSDHVRLGAGGSWAPAAKVKGLFDPPLNPTPMATPASIPMATPASIPMATPASLSSKFDPETLEKALNSYGEQGWRVRTGDSASFPGFLSSNREELITILERDEGSDSMIIYEYKVLTQKDKWYSGKFDPERLESAINAYAQQGWAVVFGTSASFPGFFSSNREELIVVLSRRKIQ